MKTSELLRLARAKIEAPGTWMHGSRCSDALAIDADGKRVHVDSPDAWAWTAVGAVFAVGGTAGGSQFGEHGAAIESLRRATHSSSFYTWQDESWRVHADILSAFDMAIEHAERGGQ